MGGGGGGAAVGVLKEAKLTTAATPSQTLVVPAVISLVLYLAIAHLVWPWLRRRRRRYHQYLPVDGVVATRGASLRLRFVGLLRFVRTAVTGARARRGVVDGADGSGDGDGVGDGEGDGDGSRVDPDEGEHMVWFDVDPQRREALQRRAAAGFAPAERRLSRELEEGFRDDSDSDSDSDHERGTPYAPAPAR
ncbi:MAG: hypothetical protein M1826_002710 [Phylliscum demangeonii]|nr:MAG: hypothetical protein M1826_002710 [Phylliscum demangeonii]